MRDALLALTVILAHEATACPTIATGTPSQAQLPVHTVLAEDEIRTLDSEVFHHLDGYMAPRRVADAGCGYVSYVPCYEGDTDTDADSDSDTDMDVEAGVDVEASYLVGSYAISILSAEESSGLQTWLDTNGYYLPEGAVERLAEYIEAGSYFFVAKVSEEATSADGTPLMPLQVSYESESISIPIRLAALSAVESQDMVIYAITDASESRVGLSNYTEVTVPDQCVWGKYVDGDFSADQAATFDRAWAAAGEAAWASEFSNYAGDCNPCTDYNPFNGTYEGDILEELGFVGPFVEGQAGWPWVTRLHMRYDRETAIADLMLYPSGIQEADVLSYADDTIGNRDCIHSYCDGSATEDPKTVYEECPEDTGPAGDDGTGGADGADGADGGGGGLDAGGDEGAEANKEGIACGCAQGRASGLGLSLAGVALLLGRRLRPRPGDRAL